MMDMQTALSKALTGMADSTKPPPGQSSGSVFKIMPRKDAMPQQTSDLGDPADQGQKPASVRETPANLSITCGTTVVEIPIQSSSTGKGAEAIDRALALMDMSLRRERAQLFQAWATGVFTLIGSGLMLGAMYHGSKNPQFRE